MLFTRLGRALQNNSEGAKTKKKKKSDRVFLTVPLQGYELPAIEELCSWGFSDFSRVVADFYEVIISEARSIHFNALVVAARHFPERPQLLDELAVLIDPDTIRGPLSAEDGAAYELALKAALSMMRACFAGAASTSTVLAPPERVIRSPILSEMDQLLEDRCMGHYRAVFAHFGVGSPAAVQELSDATLRHMNVRTADIRRIRKWASHRASAPGSPKDDASMD